MSDKHLVETKHASTEVFKGKFLHAFNDTVHLPDGTTAQREYIVHPGAVVIVPMLQDPAGQMRLVLERQFRYPVGQVMVEFPAGKLDAGEGGLACAQRELLEETGYRATQWVKAGVMHPVIAYSTEFIEIWFARDLTLGQRKLDKGEFLDVFTATQAELEQWILDGQVSDAKTLVCTLWLQNLQAGRWQPQWQQATPLAVG